MQSILENVLGGVIAGLIANYIFVLFQFKRSVAYHRLQMVKEATQVFVSEKANRSHARDQYRYSLGVIIDLLHNTKDVKDQWAPLINPSDVNRDDGKGPWDRWRQFNTYVRPVIDDMNSFSFRGLLWKRHYNLLIRLCVQLEKTVSVLDAAFEHEPVIKFEHGKIVPVDPDDDRVGAVRKEYAQLKVIWGQWKRIV